MLTPEQIKNLKEGDIIYLNNYPLTFCNASNDISIISARDDASTCGEGDLCWFTREYLTMQPQPKHDPTRLFRKGDRIRFKTWHGFLPSDWENEAELLGKEATVYEDQEKDEFSVHFLFDGEDPEEEWHATYLPFIELITPVEALEPYLMLENVPSNSIEVRDKRTNKVEATFYFGKDHAYTFEQAATRAEAERDRLNAEYRKEQNND